MKTLFFVALIKIQLFQLAGSISFGTCRPPEKWAFSFDCAQNQFTWVQDALFGVVTDGGALSYFCDSTRGQVAPNRTSECIPHRSDDTRNIRLACNTVRGQCQPEGPNEIMHTNTTFDSCPQPRSFTYSYAHYDCLPEFRSTDNRPIQFVYVNPSSLPSSSYEKIYLVSSGYDSKGYTTLPVNQCSVKVSSGVLSMVRFTVLDLLGQTTDGSSVSCPYTLSVSGAGISKDWCAQQNWNFYDVYQLNISANSATQVTLSVRFNAPGGSTATRGRFWIFVEGITTDGTASTIETSDGLPSSSTSTTTPTTTTTTTPTTTTTTTPTTTTTTPTTTTTTPTTTTTTTPTTTTTTTPTTTTTTPTTTTPTTTTTSTTTTTTTTTPTTTSTIAATSSSSTLRMTPSVIATTTVTPTSSTTTTIVPTPSTTTTTTTTPTTTTPSTTSTTTASTTSTTTMAAILSSPAVPVSSTVTIIQPLTTEHQTAGNNNSVSSNSSMVGFTPEPESADSKTSSRVVAIAVGASVGGAVLLLIIVPVIICLCMYCSRKKRKPKTRSPRPLPAPSVHSGSAASVYAISPAATVNRPSSPGGGGGGGGDGDEIYSEINESRFDITITGTMNPTMHPSTGGHQFSVRYTVGGRNNADVHKRVKGRPPQLDEEQWCDVAEVDSPPPYSDGRNNKRTGGPSGQRPGNKRGGGGGRWGKNKLPVPPGDSGESDTDVQHNPLYGMGLQGRDGNQSEDYNY